MAKDRPVDRRRFFRAALGEVFKPLSKAVAPIERAAEHLGKMSELDKRAAPPQPAGQSAAPASPRLTLRVGACLRPPGALPEDRFAETCSRCGDCVQACPVGAIRIEPDGRGGGFPFVDPAASACVLCDGLYCMHRCPSGALLPTLRADIDMGTAGWREPKCVRSNDQECTLCIDRCPIGPAAIELRAGLVHVNEDGCTGCGVCEQVCPTSPKAIVVVPKASRA
jgi:ferredoxin-type protein NapG